MPPKNITSVARNAHIPRRAASCCWARASKWGARPRVSCATAGAALARAELADNLHLLARVVVRLLRHDRHRLEVRRRRRRGRLPLEARRLPRVLARDL